MIWILFKLISIVFEYHCPWTNKCILSACIVRGFAPHRWHFSGISRSSLTALADSFKIFPSAKMRRISSINKFVNFWSLCYVHDICLSLAYRHAKWTVGYWMNSNVFGFWESANWSQLKSRANAIAACLAQHDSRFWIDVAFVYSFWWYPVPCYTFPSTASRGLLSTVKEYFGEDFTVFFGYK